MKIVANFSPNFSKKTSKRVIKFVIIHYTGMQSEIESINRLKNSKIKSELPLFNKQKRQNY